MNIHKSIKSLVQKLSLSFCIFLILPGSIYADLDIEFKDKVDQKIERISKKIEPYSKLRKKQIINFLSGELNKKISIKNRELLNYIVISLEGLVIDRKILSHNALVLRFNSGADHTALINSKREQIIKNQSVFIFRNNGIDLTRMEISSIIDSLYKINEKLFVFIDQEGGYVNRYKDFDSGKPVSDYINYTFVSDRMSLLNGESQLLIKNFFYSSRQYFPSLGSIGVQYDQFKDEQSKQSFLEISAYIRLKSLEENGINTYGLVADLNRGNPAISLNARSFSKHKDKYIKLIDAFINASDQTGVLLYLKHFPGHGAGTIDSHSAVLDLRSHTAYLKENMELFEYFLNNKNNSGGLMIAHVLFDDSIKTIFQRLSSNADFLLTDDLAMQGYRKICGVNQDATQCSISTGVFSTNQIFGTSNLIKVNTQYVENVY